MDDSLTMPTTGVSFTIPNSVPQGWQCPVCFHVYSPTTTTCATCPTTGAGYWRVIPRTVEPAADHSCNVTGCPGWWCGIRGKI